MEILGKFRLNVLFIILITLTVLIGFSGQINAEQEGDFIYTITDEQAQVTGYSGVGGSVFIPETLGGFSVTSIGNTAFLNCTQITSIDIPRTVEKIGIAPFSNCIALKSITVAADNLAYTDINGVLYNDECTVLVAWPGGENNVVIPANVTCIGDYAFYACTELSVIELPEGVAEIGCYAFGGCTRLENIILPQSIINIGDGAFTGCIRLNTINLPKMVNVIGENAFLSCTGLTSITLPQDATNIEKYAFGDCWSLHSIDIPRGVANISTQAFNGCKGLTAVNIQEGLITIGDRAFNNCSNLRSINIPASVQLINDRAFNNCTALSSIRINSSKTQIIDLWYYSGVTIPPTTTIIGYDPSTAKDYAIKYGNPFEVLASKKKAIYVLPGFLGSELYETSGSESQKAWHDDNFLIADNIVYIKNSVLGGPQSQFTRNNDGSGIVGSELFQNSDLDPSGTDDGYSHLIERLNTDCSKDYDVVFFPYNWLGDLNDSEKQLENDIRTKGYDEVVFVTHSTGGLLAAAYMAASEENKNRVKKAILIAAPLYGTYESYKTIETGQHPMIKDKITPIVKDGIKNGMKVLGYEWLNQNGLGDFAGDAAGNAIVDAMKGWVRNTLVNSPTAYQLFPSNEYFSTVPIVIKEVNYSIDPNPIGSNPLNPEIPSYNPLVKTGSEKTTYIKSIAELSGKFSSGYYFNANLIDGNSRSHLYFRNNSLHGDIVDSLMDDKEVKKGQEKTVLIGSSSCDETTADGKKQPKLTVVGAYYTLNQYGGVVLSDYNMIPQGDGTVPVNSAFGNRGTPYRLNRLKYMDFGEYQLDHGELASNDTVINHIISEINGTNTEYGVIANPTVKAESTDSGMTDRIKYNIQSEQPCDIKITNADGVVLASVIDGEETGFDNGQYVFQVLSSSETGNTAMLYVPNTGVKVEFYSGSASGKIVNFIANVSTLDNDGFKTATSTYTAITTGELGLILSFNQLSTVVDQTNLGNLVENRFAPPVMNLTDWYVPESVKLELGEVHEIEITGADANTARNSLTWDSSDDSIVSVSETGVLTAKGYGFATIYASNGNKVMTSQIIVKRMAESVDLGDIELHVNMQNRLKPTFTPTNTTETNITYQTNNSDLISIDENGVVIGLKEGVATVTGTTDNGLSDTFTVTVKPDPAAEATLQSIAITNPATKLSYTIGDALDLSDLVVTGTYSDGTTKTETVTADNITGFDSSKPATDQVLTITINGKTTTYTVQIIDLNERQLGDVDGNGSITAYDALMALQIATGKKTGTTEELKAADVDNSGSVGAFDALRILQYATGKITSF